jgi:outer membrane protein assembly factor BamB
MKAVSVSILLLFFAVVSNSQTVWQANLDSRVRFYQTTDFGVVLAGTEKNLYAMDGKTGERLWRRQTGTIEETAITPIPDTDLILFSRDIGEKSRLQAVDLMSGNMLWESDKVKGDVMQLAVDPEADLVAVVLVKDPRGKAADGLQRKPVVHMLRLSTGEELWKKELDGGIDMMPSRFGENLGEIAFTLDNYRAPLLLDGRLFIFYEGATSYDADTGSEKEREKFTINEDGLALTEADPVYDDTYIYISGRGRVRAVNRKTGQVDWKADDIGNCAEMAIVGGVLYARTGGQFTRIKDGEAENKGPYGVAAIDLKKKKTLWRYKGADKGLTNFAFSDPETILVADKDDLIKINAATGKKIAEFEHGIEKAQFVLVNENGQAVVGGKDEIAAFDLGRGRLASNENALFRNAAYSLADEKAPEAWRVRHKAPGRGAFRIIAGIALRATALYFRYGGLATSALNIVRGAGLVRSALSFRWSGLKTRFGSFDLTTLASNSARNYVTRKVYSFGSIGTTPNLLSGIGSIPGLQGFQVITPGQIRGKIIGTAINRATPSRAEVQESLLDRLDPIHQVERLSDYLLRRKRLAELRGNYMYFYTDLPKPYNRKGLAGVNIQTGQDGRFVLVSDPDRQFVTDDTVNLLYSADGSRLQAYEVLNK